MLMSSNQNIDIQKKKKVALVLSGGGVKAAAFHIGVCLALKEKGFYFHTNSKNGSDTHPIKLFVGSSAGAFMSAILSSGYSIESLMNAFKIDHKNHSSEEAHPNIKPLKYWNLFRPNKTNISRLIPFTMQRRDLRFGGLESLLKRLVKINGVFTTQGLEKYLRKNVLHSNEFKDMENELYIVATQLDHSRKVVFGPFDKTSDLNDVKLANYAKISDAVAASASLPPAFAPYSILNEKGEKIYFFDGEIRDTLSTHIAVDQGADLVINSYSIQPYHYNKKMGSLNNYGIPLIMNQALYQVVEQKIERHRKNQEDLKKVLSIVNSYFKQNNLPDLHRDTLLNTLRKKLDIADHVDQIAIHPHPQDYEMFFYDHFSFNAKVLSHVVRIGFRSAMKTLTEKGI